MSAAARRPRPTATPAAQPPGVPFEGTSPAWLDAGIVGLALLASIATLAPGMWGWGPGNARFVPMPWRIAWLLPLLALLPVAGAPLARGFERLGAALDARRGGVPAFALGALLVLPFADQTWFTGDFVLRLSSIELGNFRDNYGAAMLLDWFLHGGLPRLLLPDPGEQGAAWFHALGTIECGLLALAARAWTRTLGLRGAETAAGVLLVVGGGALAVFTGLGKPAALMAVFALATLVTGVSVARGGGGHGRLGVLVALALMVHRSAILLLPGWLMAAIAAIGIERAAATPRWRRLAALALPLPVLAFAWPRLLGLTWSYDLPHHLTPGGSVTGQAAAGGWFGPLHLLDVANALLLMAPLFVLALPVFALTGAPRWRDPAERVRLAMAVPALLVILLVFPQQGIFRDLDVFAPWMVVLAAIALGAVAARVSAGPRRALALSRAALLTLALGLALIAAYADPAGGLARVRAYVAGPPRRDASTRALGWDFLVQRDVRLGRLDDAVACLDEAIALAPHRRLFLTRSLIEARRQRPDRVAAAYAEMVRRWPDDALGWFGLAGARAALGDETGRDEALARAAVLIRGNDLKRIEIVRYRAGFPELWPGPPGLADSLLAPR